MDYLLAVVLLQVAEYSFSNNLLLHAQLLLKLTTQGHSALKAAILAIT